MGNEQENQNNQQNQGKQKGGGGNAPQQGVSLVGNINAAQMTGWEPIKTSMSGHTKNALGFIFAGLVIGLIGPYVDKLFGVKTPAAGGGGQQPQIKPGQAAYVLAQLKKADPGAFDAVKNKFTDVWEAPPKQEG